MFKQITPKPKSLETRNHILSTALCIFRERGFEAATMRDLAAAADTSLGSAYYYFPSKEAIIQAYYDDVQAEHTARVAAALSDSSLDLKERLRIAFHSKLEILQGDRRLLGALFRYTGEPGHPLSVLGSGTLQNRQQSIAVFTSAIGNERLPDDIRVLLPTALWALHMGILLYFIYDDSPAQERTHRLVDGTLTLLTRLLSLAKLPLLKPVRGSVLTLLREAGLIPDANRFESSDGLVETGGTPQ
jgi:AcrR family transcriptional regulator